MVWLGILTVQAAEPSMWVYDADQISDISISSDGSIILIGGERIYCFSKGGDLIWKEWFCEQIEISPDGEYIVYSNDYTLTVKNKNGTQIWEKDIGKITDIAITSNGLRIIASDIGCNIYFFNRSGELITEKNIMHKDISRVQDLKITGNGQSVIVLTDKGWYYFTIDGNLMQKQEDNLDNGLRGNGGSFVSISTDGRFFVTVQDYNIKYYREGSLLWKYCLKDEITSIAISSDGSNIAVGSQDNTVHFLDSVGKELWNYSTGCWIRDIDIASDASTIIAGSMDNQAYLFDNNGTVLAAINVGGWVDHVSMTQDGSFAVAASKQSIIGIPISDLRIRPVDTYSQNIRKLEPVQPTIILNDSNAPLPVEKVPSIISDIYTVLSVLLIFLAVWLFLRRLT